MSSATPDEHGDRFYLSQHIRLVEQRAMSELLLSEQALMQRAGEAALDAIQHCYSAIKSLQIFCGTGNNAGDGYTLASLARAEGWRVSIVQVGEMHSPSTSTQAAIAAAEQADIPILPFASPMPIDADLLVDAMLGIGFKAPLRAPFPAAILRMNQSGRPILALDVPSGLSADTGAAAQTTVQADTTITFIGKKLGLVTGAGPQHVGQLKLATLALPNSLLDTMPVTARALQLAAMQAYLPPRARNAHKGDFGHVLIVGGSQGFGGAVMLSAAAALRAGAGLVSVATSPTHVMPLLARMPEVMAHGINNIAQMQQLVTQASVIVVGPGLGQTPWGKGLFAACLQAGKPLIVDADALTMLAAMPCQQAHWILTPHPGEAARLLGCDTAAINRARLKSAQAISKRYGGVCVLKGAGSLVTRGQRDVSVCLAGNPGMASGGMGDLLAGLLGGLLAQGLGLDIAAKVGVQIHASAADLAARPSGERGLVASDLLPYVQRLVNASDYPA